MKKQIFFKCIIFAAMFIEIGFSDDNIHPNLLNDILHPKTERSALIKNTAQLLNTTITLKILLVEFSDVKHRTSPSAYTKADFENLLISNGTYVTNNNGTGKRSPDGEYVYGSMRDYFWKMSNGNLTITGSVVNNVQNNIPIWITLPNTKTFYNNIHTDTLISHVKSAAIANGLNISGLGDYVKLVIIYAGNVYFNYYLNPRSDKSPGTLYIMSERNGGPTNPCGEHETDKFARIGLHCHEFAHTIGVGHSSASRADLMCGGVNNGPDNGGYNGAAPAPINPIERMIRGWIPSPTLIYGSRGLTCIVNYSLTAQATFKINSNNTYGDYFIIENRRFNQNMTIGSTTIPDYNNSAFMPLAHSQNSTDVIYQQGIMVWRYTGKYGEQYDYANVGLIYASGRYGASYPDNILTETDAGDIFPGTANVKILSPWSDSRDPYGTEGADDHWTLYVPNTQGGTNVGMEILEENIPNGYYKLILYPAQQLLPSTISSTQTLNGEYICMSNVTVNPGVTLNVSAGSTIVLQNGVSFTNNGILNINGTSSRPVTFTSQKGNSQNSWGAFVLNGSGANGSNINYLNLQYGSGINITNTTNITIQNSTIQNCTNGIVGSNVTASILINKIINVTNHGISLSNCTFTCSQNVIKKTSDFAYYHTGFGILYNGGSSGTVWQNDIRGFNQGIGALWGSSPTSFGSYSIQRNNRITNCLTGLLVYAQSYPIFGTNPPSDYMWNSIYSNTKNVEVGVQSPSYSSGLLAFGNWWGNNPPNTALFSVGANSWFYYNPYRTSDPWISYPLPSVIATSNSSNEVTVLQKVSIDNQNINQSNSTDLTKSLLNGIELRYQNKYKEAKDYFLSYLSKYPENQVAYIELYNCYNEETAQEIIDYFNALPPQASNVHKLLLSNLYLKRGNVDMAKKINSDIIHGNPNTPLAARAKLNNINIALNNDNDYNNAISMFTDILKGPKYSLDIDLSLTEELIETYAVTHGITKPNFNIQGGTDVLYLTTTDISNYPNPFNPSTVVNYQLPEQGHVSIKVFDLLGREVATLVDEVKETGRYSVNFDGSKLSSGVYFIRMNIQPQEGAAIVQVKKMLLTK